MSYLRRMLKELTHMLCPSDERQCHQLIYPVSWIYHTVVLRFNTSSCFKYEVRKFLRLFCDEVFVLACRTSGNSCNFLIPTNLQSVTLDLPFTTDPQSACLVLSFPRQWPFLLIILSLSNANAVTFVCCLGSSSFIHVHH